MKKVILILGVVTSVFRSYGQGTIASTSYTLEQCISYGLENQNRIAIAKLDYDESKAKVGETRGMGLPQIDGKMDFVDNISIQNQFLPANAFNPTAPANQVEAVGFGVQYTNNINLTLNQLIFDGSYLVGLKSAKTYKSMSLKSIKQTEVEVVEQIAKGFYAVLVTAERLSFIGTEYERTETLKREMNLQYEGGFVELIDVKRVTVNLNNLDIESQKLERLQEVNIQLLKFYMGMPQDDNFAINGDLEKDLSKLVYEESQSSVYQNRVDYQLMEVQEELGALNVSFEKSTFYPKLYGFASTGWNTGALTIGDMTSNYSNYTMIGLQLQVPIFSGLTRKYKLDQAKIQLNKTKYNKELLEQSIDTEVKSASTMYSNNKESLVFYKENMELAEEVYDVTKIKYDEGLASSFELTSTEQDRKQALTNYYVALYDVIVAKIDLLKATGQLHK